MGSWLSDFFGSKKDSPDLVSSNASNLRESFYELLQNFSTFPAAQNFFLVNIDTLPSAITENDINKLGVRTGTTSSGLDAATTTFQPYFGGGNNWMFLATGIDLTTETTNVNNRGTLINGLLPVGPFMEAREYPDNDLDIQFSDTNISLVDSIFRSWVQLYSVYGNTTEPLLSTNITISYISKQTVDGGWDPDPVIRKNYIYKDCIPYIIKTQNVAEYDGDTKIGSITVGWRFSKYDVNIPFN
jgi:hypothetical protein